MTAEAARRGLSPAGYVEELIRIVTPELPAPDQALDPEEVKELLFGPWPEDEPKPTTPAEVVAYWERHGLLGTRPDIEDSLEYARAHCRLCRGRGATLCTFNVKHYRVIAGLVTEQPYTR